MSDHFDTDDPLTDLTDLYAFPGSVAGRTVLIVDFNPEPAAQEVPFDTAASYELKIDTDGDAEADVAFHVLFSSTPGGARATVYRSSGALAREGGAVGEAIIEDAPVSLDGDLRITEANGYRFFAGIRSDPHFKDVKGFQNDFQFTGEDPVALRDVVGIVLEVPNGALSSSPPVRIWARTTTSSDGMTTIIDQAGLPGTNNTWNVEDADHAAFTVTAPIEQAEAFRDKFEAVLADLGYADDQAAEVAHGLLPDVLTYDWLQAPGFPNGRRLTDDTADWLLALLTRGRLTSDGVGPHTDLLADFPYLGQPHLAARS
ncbi:MAG TPA: DUF4331 family protein [Candidatus Limnocylindrales bacterium]|jgi:hypothetical protein|nr:DUF4331 family protein [Candidatus Limnocylindrales bacterium]